MFLKALLQSLNSRSLFSKFQKIGNLGYELVGNIGRKQRVITPKNFDTVSEIVKKKIWENPLAEI